MTRRPRPLSLKLVGSSQQVLDAIQERLAADARADRWRAAVRRPMVLGVFFVGFAFFIPGLPLWPAQLVVALAIVLLLFWSERWEPDWPETLSTLLLPAVDRFSDELPAGVELHLEADLGVAVREELKVHFSTIRPKVEPTPPGSRAPARVSIQSSTFQIPVLTLQATLADGRLLCWSLVDEVHRETTETLQVVRPHGRNSVRRSSQSRYTCQRTIAAVLEHGGLRARAEETLSGAPAPTPAAFESETTLAALFRAHRGATASSPVAVQSPAGTSAPVRHAVPSSPPAGVTVASTAEGERVELAAVKVPTLFGSTAVFFAGFLGLPLLPFVAMYVLGDGGSPLLRGSLGVLAMVGAAGGLSLAWTQLWKSLSTRMGGELVVDLSQLAMTVDDVAYSWGDIASIKSTVGGLRLEPYEGEHTQIEAKHQPHKRITWLAAHLEEARRRFAPGSPEDLPEEMRALRQEATRREDLLPRSG